MSTTGHPDASIPVVAVIGGGIAGLAAAWELAHSPDPVHVVVFEAAETFGGKLQLAAFAGRQVDVAADAFLARRPEATDLCQELGITDNLVPVGTTGASVWARGRLRPLPAGLQLGIPTRWWPVARSGILGLAHALAMTKDFLLPHRARNIAIGDRSVAEIVAERLGRPVVDALVDPLIGGIHAGGVDDLSAAATFPVLIAVGHQPGSLMRRLRIATRPTARTVTEDRVDTSISRPMGESEANPPPVFWSLGQGTASLIDRLIEQLGVRGVDLQASTGVEALGRARTDQQWELSIRHRGDLTLRRLVVDGVVLATPAPQTAQLLTGHAPTAAGLLNTFDYGSVAVVTMTFDANAVHSPLGGTGFLVPRTTTINSQPALMTGCTYLDRKWPRLRRENEVLLRVSVGRFGDTRMQHLDNQALIHAVVDELGTMLDLSGPPTSSMVTRWPDAFPQYRVGHLIRVAKIEEDLRRLPAIAGAGAAYRGVGIPACIASGRTAANEVLRSLHEARPHLDSTNGFEPPS